MIKTPSKNEAETTAALGSFTNIEQREREKEILIYNMCILKKRGGRRRRRKRRRRKKREGSRTGRAVGRESNSPCSLPPHLRVLPQPK